MLREIARQDDLIACRNRRHGADGGDHILTVGYFESGVAVLLVPIDYIFYIALQLEQVFRHMRHLE